MSFWQACCTQGSYRKHKVNFKNIRAEKKDFFKLFERVYFLKVLTVHHDVNGGVLVGAVDKYFACL